MVLLQPLHQGSTSVQRDIQIGKRFEDIQKRQVTVLVSVFKDAVEVADGLVVVKHQTKLNV